MFLDEKDDVAGLAFDNLKKFEAAGLVVERHHVVGGLIGFVFFAVGVHLGAVAAVEGVEPGFEDLAGGSVWDVGLRKSWRGCCEQQ